MAYRKPLRDRPSRMDVRQPAVSRAFAAVEAGAFLVAFELRHPGSSADEAPQTDSRKGSASAGAGPAVVGACGRCVAADVFGRWWGGGGGGGDGGGGCRCHHLA